MALTVAASALVVAAMLAGCATAARSNSSGSTDMGNYQRQSEAIAQREHECEAAVVKNDKDTPTPAVNSQRATLPRQLLFTELAKAWSVAQCKAEADQENEQLASRQRTEYEQHRREEHDRAALMMTLTTSLQR